jgi:hypothetical protein
MRNSHIHDHLTVAKLSAIAAHDTMLAYLIDMAIIHEAQRSKQDAPRAAIDKAA